MTKPNSLVCLDSCLEVFLNPYPDFTRDYLNFEMNAAGTLVKIAHRVLRQSGGCGAVYLLQKCKGYFQLHTPHIRQLPGMYLRVMRHCQVDKAAVGAVGAFLQ